MTKARNRTGDTIDLGPPPYPNDRERAIALRIMSKHERGDGSHAALLTSIAKGLAGYRLELRYGKVSDPLEVDAP